MIRSMQFAACVALLVTGAVAEEFRDAEAYWVVLHESAAVEELKLTSNQRPQYRELVDGYDLRYFPLRNKSPDEAHAGVIKLVGEIRGELNDLLTARQRERLQQLTYRRIGLASILHDDVAKQLKISASQRTRLETLINDMQTTLAEIEKKVQAGEERAPLDKQYKDTQRSAQKKFQQILKPDQHQTYLDVLGPDVDAAKYGRPAYKIPELIASDGWINSDGLQLADLRGKVVVVHFYACGCINCIHNYPSYRNWQKQFAGKDVVLIGIHSPETPTERNLDHVRQKAAEEKLTFPILLDAQSANWNAWGNSMWPSVYVIDKQGYLQHFWPGELNWQGATGEKFLGEQIEKLLKAE